MNRNGDRGSKVSKGLFVCWGVFFQEYRYNQKLPLALSLSCLLLTLSPSVTQDTYKKKNAPEFTLAPTLLLKC